MRALFSSLLVLPLLAQRQVGELRLQVTDPAGAGLEAAITLTGLAVEVRRSEATDSEGRFIARELPFGRYRLEVTRAGFSRLETLIEIRSEVPLERQIALGVAPFEAAVTVRDSDTMLDPERTGAVFHIGADTLAVRRAAIPARGVLELVNRQPGWLLEAHGVLHPRGSEYDTQYVVDGIPVLDNRSPAFAPAFEAEELSAMRILTGGYPAEYGRKLGGIIELVTARDKRSGFHGKTVFQGGSFRTGSGFVQGTYAGGRNALGLSIQGARTDRFLDPPVEANLTNRGFSGGGALRAERDLNAYDRVRFYIHRKRTGFLVPNELVQQQAGQRQDRTVMETMGQAAYQRVVPGQWLLDCRAMVRDLSARLWSNALSVPVLAGQDRGFREGYWSASATASRSRHSVKFGAEAALTPLREQFSYRLTDENFFQEDGGLEIPTEFRFAGRKSGSEYAAYAQDLVRLGRLTLHVGLRWDRYRLLVTEQFLSPRLSAAWHLPVSGLVARASWDRAVTVPAIENLLLSSSPEAQRLSREAASLPLRAARGHFYEVGLAKTLSGRLRLDASWYRRAIRNFADDDVFLNTGVSFPISFDSARIHGVEAKLELLRWRAVSGYVSWSNLGGTGRLPITGGLFLEAGGEELTSKASFPISQDQRNTVQARFRFDLHPRVWTAAGVWYNSGLPVEREGELEDEDTWEDRDALTARYGERVISQVNFGRGRVRPSHAVDLSLGAILLRRETRSLSLQADALNVENRLNVINFAGLFSGTALNTPRMVHLRLQLEF